MCILTEMCSWDCLWGLCDCPVSVCMIPYACRNLWKSLIDHPADFYQWLTSQVSLCPLREYISWAELSTDKNSQLDLVLLGVLWQGGSFIQLTLPQVGLEIEAATTHRHLGERKGLGLISSFISLSLWCPKYEFTEKLLLEPQAHFLRGAEARWKENVFTEFEKNLGHVRICMF